MRLHRFIGEFNLDSKTLAVVDGELVQQWRNVLRLKTGDSVLLSDGAGREARAVIMNMDKNSAKLSRESLDSPAREPQKTVTLFCAVLKRENFELVVQKATEIGVSRIVPLLTERTIKTGHNRDRLEKIIKEAAEQSGRTTLPELSEPMPFIEAIKSVVAKESVLFDLSGSVFDASSNKLATKNCFIGPEGGFSEAEVSTACELGIAIGSLGSLTLRGETAAIVAAYLLCAH